MTHLEQIDHKPLRRKARLAQGNKSNRKMRRFYASLTTQNAIARNTRRVA